MARQYHKRHYEAFARIFARARREAPGDRWGMIERAVSEMFEADSPQYDSRQFWVRVNRLAREEGA